MDSCGGRTGILPLVEGALVAARPHVVLLMIGTNDVASGCDLDASFASLVRLATVVEHAAPSATLVVASLVPSQSAPLDARADAYSAKIAPFVAERAAGGQRIRFVDMGAPFRAVPAFRTALFTDTLHPNDAGYEIMAKTWAGALGL